MKINVDMSIKDVLRLDKEGVDLFFESKLGRFLNLGKDYKELDEKNKNAYLIAKGLNAEEREIEEKDLKPSDISITGRFATATSRLEVQNKQKGMHYVWKRPDELPLFESLGYFRWTPDRPEIPFSSRGVIGKAGEEELVLLITTEENHMAWVRDVERKSKSMSVAPIDTAKSAGLKEVGAIKE